MSGRRLARGARILAAGLAMLTVGALAPVAVAGPASGGAEDAGPAVAATPSPRAGRHALIIGVGRYQADPARPVTPLAGVAHDMHSARSIAAMLQVPAANTVVLQDAQATRAGIEQALAALRARVQPGDRVFIYWSGHGSRYYDEHAQACVETLIPHDLKDFSHREFAQRVRPIGEVADKLFVVYDACHSGGATTPGTAPARSWGGFQPKTSGVSAQCSVASNVRHRGFEAAAGAAGMGLGDVVHIASSRPDEVSFDNPAAGGLATVALRRCLQGEARDLDGSGAVSAGEVVACAQALVERTLADQPQLLPHHLTLAGNREFVPAWFSRPASVAPAVAAPAAPVVPAAPAAAANRPPLRDPTPAELLLQLHAQRDTKRRVDLTLDAPRLRIGSDALGLAVRSSHAGHVHVLMAGTDGRSLTLLFPNALDRDNRIAAGQTLMLPRPAWRLVAGGPAGRDRLLVLVTDAPPDLSALPASAAGPFVQPVLDLSGRGALQRLFALAGAGGSGAGRSDAFGAAWLDVDEF
ncbi:caspase family protein [Ideonella sp. DXS22W]|uniref:Caspase family protein n=1 Tax=Pseudaquabacterium inlustre TaxID=2984192 RepID=A0ABU9CF70_9BURK